MKTLTKWKDNLLNGSRKWKWSHSVVSESLWPHRLQPTRLLHPWDFPGKSTWVGCHFLLQGIFPTQGSNPGLPHCRQMFLPTEPGSICKWYDYKGLISKIYKQITQPDIKKKKREDLNFSKEDIQMANRHMKKCWTSLIIREIKTKSQGDITSHPSECCYCYCCCYGYHQIKKSEHKKCWQGCGVKEALVLNFWECKFVQSLRNTSWKFLKKLKKNNTMWPSNSTSRYISEDNEHQFEKIHKFQCLLQPYLQ